MAAIVSTVLIATGCSDEPASTAAIEPAPEPTSEVQSSSAPTALDQPVAGQIRDSQFIAEQAILAHGTLELRQGSEFFADLAAEIVLFDENPAEKTYTVPTDGTGITPHLRLNKKLEDQSTPDQQTLMSDYQLKLVFGESEALGVPFTIELTAAKNQAELQGSGFATFGDIKVSNGKLNRRYESLDTLNLLARQYAAESYPDVTVEKTFGTTLHTSGNANPSTAFVGLEGRASDDHVIILKLQLLMEQNGWEVVNELAANQIHPAHPVLRSLKGNLRTVEGAKAAHVAGQRFESDLQQQLLVSDTRGTSIRCYLTKTADKASCRAAANVETSDGRDCQRQNYLLTNQGAEWVYESDLSPTQSVDYKSGKVIEGRGPSEYSCSA
ncbi:hypothetical protein [Marinobacter sp. S6332]|uniref:hypothetical protein n=1 Tax=Marinobacter sp. S6332 TaxID=2926403 RepID=UPI001FF67DFE|nr:hypothetical protein [Marinobacter sp. S6332]MCK0163792.1 hypothetical protein [Marinobacter sp. S6332]